MEPDHITSWGQVIFCVGAAAAMTSWGIGNLFTKMTATYGGVIKALQDQNVSQQQQLDADRREIGALTANYAKCVEKHEDCDKQQQRQQLEISALKEDRVTDKKSIAELKQEIEQLKEKSHVTGAIQDLSEKVDTMNQTKLR